MHASNSTSFICTSNSYTFGLCLVHVNQEPLTIEDSLGLPILDEVGCGPGDFLSHTELLIIPCHVRSNKFHEHARHTSYVLLPPYNLGADPSCVVYIF